MASFSTGISGLHAASKNLETIGNNVANASTVGFKQSRVEFADIYSKGGLMTGGAKAGNGVRVADISQQFTQGGTTFTQNSMDMMIDGQGFFIVKNNGMDTYTRAGTFGMDNEGFVVDNAGNRVQGFPASDDASRIEVGAINDLYIPVANIEPNATTEVNASFNLDSRKEPPSNYIFDKNDSDTYTHLYPSVIYDSLGNSHTLTQYFVKQPPYQPEQGVHARALQAMVGFSRFGSDYFTDTNGLGFYPGDSNENPGATLDTDVAAAVNSGGAVTFDFTADPAAGAGTDFTDPVNATDNERGTQLQALHDQLKDILDNGGHSGRVKEFYQDAYDALVDFLPGLSSGSVGGTAIDTGVYEGALAAIEDASLQGEAVAYGNLDTLSGVVRTALLNGGAVADPLTENVKLTSVDNTVAPLNDVANIEAFVSDLKATLNDLINGTPTTLEFPVGTALDFTLNTTGAPTPEEKATYKSALDLLNELETTYDDGAGAVNPQAVIDVLGALEDESAQNRWQVHAFVDGERVTDGNANSPEYFSFNFTPYGQLSSLPRITIRDWVPRDTASNKNGSFEPQEFSINLEGTTQFGGPFSATALKQDGYSTGELSGLDIDKSGVMNARYTNGTTRLIGQVAIATFRNEQGLTPIGGTSWRQSLESGDPVINEPGVSVAGTIQSNALEDSNVDLSQELVKMIIAQRDYQANAKTIQTADTITQTIINMR